MPSRGRGNLSSRVARAVLASLLSEGGRNTKPAGPLDCRVFIDDTKASMDPPTSPIREHGWNGSGVVTYSWAKAGGNSRSCSRGAVLAASPDKHAEACVTGDAGWNACAGIWHESGRESEPGLFLCCLARGRSSVGGLEMRKRLFKYLYYPCAQLLGRRGR